jgi:hypothetical protein
VSLDGRRGNQRVLEKARRFVLTMRAASDLHPAFNAARDRTSTATQRTTARLRLMSKCIAVRCGNRTLGRFDSAAAPLSRSGLAAQLVAPPERLDLPARIVRSSPVKTVGER